MDQKTILIILCVVVLWAVLFGVFMVFGKKRNQKAKGFYVDHQDKAILHLYGTKIKIDGKDLSEFPHTTGENLQKVVALTPVSHTIEAVFQSTENRGLKTRNVKTENIHFEVTLEAGHSYYAGLYFYSEEERKNHSKDEVDTCILEIPLSLTGEGISTAYIRVCQEH